MARDLSSPGMMLASPNQASTVFNPNGRHPIRQKHLFVVRFVRAVGASGSNDWREGLTFVVKAMDRPSVEVQCETINQYNKKKIIHTGVKYNPINVSFYDTADGAAQNMWVEYARHYFADYVQSPGSFRDDILDPELLDPSADGTGWGFQLPIAGSDPLGQNSQHFLDKVEVMQVWGNEFTKYELVNPRIQSFTPDDMTYEDGTVSQINMTLSFEAIYHENQGRPQALSADEGLAEMFTTGPFSGQVLEVEGHPKQISFVGTPSAPNGGRIDGDFSLGEGGFINPQPEDRSIFFSSEGGVLGRFGNFDFGSNSVNLTNVLVDVAEQFIGGNRRLGVAANRIADQGSGPVSGALLAIPGMATGINRATRGLQTAIIDQADRVSGGLNLSDQIVREFNAGRDGTMNVGFRRLSTDTPIE